MQIAKIATDSNMTVAVCLRWLATVAFLRGRAGTRMATEANASRSGTIFSKPSAGNDNSRTAPTRPPKAATGAMRLSHGPCPSSSGREPQIDPTPLNTTATVLVTLAVTGGRPTSSRAGYVATDASPAMPPVRPPSTPAAARKAASHHVIARPRYFAPRGGRPLGERYL